MCKARETHQDLMGLLLRKTKQILGKFLLDPLPITPTPSPHTALAQHMHNRGDGPGQASLTTYARDLRELFRVPLRSQGYCAVGRGRSAFVSSKRLPDWASLELSPSVESCGCGLGPSPVRLG